MSTLTHDVRATKPERTITLVARRRCIECDRPLHGATAPQVCAVCEDAKLCRMLLEMIIEEGNGVLVHSAAQWLDRIQTERWLFLDVHAREAMEAGAADAKTRTPRFYTPQAVRTVKDPVLPTDDDLDELPF